MTQWRKPVVACGSVIRRVKARLWPLLTFVAGPVFRRPGRRVGEAADAPARIPTSAGMR